MSVTLADIAEKTNLSKMTVSHILRGAGTVRPETRKRVLEMASQLGYHTNSAARAMRKGRFDTVGLLFRSSTYDIDLPPRVISGIAETLEKNDFKMILVKTSNDSLLKKNSLTSIPNKFMVDGLIVSCWGEIPDELREMAEITEQPVCWINSDCQHNCVYPDDRSAGRMATEHLLRLGHRKIALVDYTGYFHFSVVGRSKGYADAMADADLKPRIIKKRIATGYGFEGFLELFSSGDRPTAIVTLSHFEAQPIIYCAAHLGLKVPGDLSVITIDERLASSMGIDISSVVFPEREIGVESAKMLLSRLEGNGRPISSVTVPFMEIMGSTCAPPLLYSEARQNRTERQIKKRIYELDKRRKLQ